MPVTRNKVLIGDLMMLAVAVIWGATNVVIRDALTGLGPLWFCAIRFVIALAALSCLFGRRALAMPRGRGLAGVALGMYMTVGYLLSAVALLYTTAGNMSFIMSMFVVGVPLSVWALSRKFPGWHVVASVVLCALGLAGLMLGDSLAVNFGDLLCLAVTVHVTIYILLVQKYVQGVDPYGLAWWQAVGGVIFSLAVALGWERFPAAISMAGWLAILFSALVGFAATLVLQTAGQKYTSATHAAIILSTSGVFGSVLGIIFLDEPMTCRIAIASAMILAGVLIVESAPAWKRRHPLFKRRSELKMGRKKA